MTDDFPADVRRFIEQNIESLAQLEMLLLLHSDKDRFWDVEVVSSSLSIPPSMSKALLTEFTRRGFAIFKDECYKCQAVDTDSDQLLGKLRETYRTRRVAVTNEIYSKPNARLKSFADAFRLRREQ
jgi:hypothetical protein